MQVPAKLDAGLIVPAVAMVMVMPAASLVAVMPARPAVIVPLPVVLGMRATTMPPGIPSALAAVFVPVPASVAGFVATPMVLPVIPVLDPVITGVSPILCLDRRGNGQHQRGQRRDQQKFQWSPGHVSISLVQRERWLWPL